MDVDKLKDSIGQAGFKVLEGSEADAFLSMMHNKAQEMKDRKTPRYRYESQYQFPDDVNVHGSKDMDPEGFRNSTHLSISRGMEFLEDKDEKEFEQREIAGIVGVTDDNRKMELLKNHINACVMDELGENWGHSGFSMSMAVQHVLKAKKIGWEKYIQYVRGFAVE